MAVVKLLPRKATPGQGRKQSMVARLDYDENPDKTREGKLVSSYMCSPETAAMEFEAAKTIYEASTGRSQPRDRDVIMYRVMQSFKPGEVTPEEANRIGYELAMEFTKGQHQFVVCTHEDKAHIHNHIEINSTNLECDGKFENVKDSVKVLRRINDRICLAHGLSVPEPRRERAPSQGEKGAMQQGRSFKERLRYTIDRQLPGCDDFEGFLARMREDGYEVRHRGKSLEFRAPGQERFTRSFRLGEEYTEVALRKRIGDWDKTPGREQLQAVNRGSTDRHGIAGSYGTGDFQDAGSYQGEEKPYQGERLHKMPDGGHFKNRNQSTSGAKTGQRPKSASGAGYRNTDRKVNLLVDIQAKLQAGMGKGYERWARVFNLKEASKTVNFLTENNVADYEELEARTETAGQKFDFLSARIKQLEGQMAEKAQMKMHIINYAKTRDVYAAYKKSRYRDSFRNQHQEEIKKHEAAKAAFDALGGKDIPKVAELSKEYAALLAEKKQCYEEYKAARQEMIKYQTAKRNVDVILGMGEDTRKKQVREQKAEH